MAGDGGHSASLSGITLIRDSSCHSPIRSATMNNTADMAEIGTLPAHPAKTSTIPKRVRLCTIPAMGDLAPLLMFAEVRAIAPVAGKPPNEEGREAVDEMV